MNRIRNTFLSDRNTNLLFNFVKKNVSQQTGMGVGDEYLQQVQRDMIWTVDNISQVPQGISDKGLLLALNQKVLSKSSPTIINQIKQNNNRMSSQHRNSLLEQQQGSSVSYPQRPMAQQFGNQQQAHPKDLERHFQQMQQQRNTALSLFC